MRKVAEQVMATRRSTTGYPRSARCPLLVAVIVLYALAYVILPGVVFAAPEYPEAVGNINDFAGVLSAEDETNLDALVDSVLDQTGATIAVAVLDSLEDESPQVYAVRLYEKWGIGKKGEDKGLLLLVTMQEHEMRMEVGYGLEGVVTDRRAGESLDKMVPYFQKGEYGKGIYAGLLHAAQYVAKDAGVSLEVKPATKEYEPVVKGGQPFPLALMAAFISIPVVMAMFFGIRGRRCPRCKARLTTTDRVVQRASYDAGGLALKVLHCPKCGYHDEKPFRTSRLTKPGSGGMPPIGPGPFWGGLGGGGKGGGGFFGPRGFGGGRSGGGGAGRKW